MRGVGGRIAGLAVALLTTLSGPATAADGVWFLHRFGEMRAYFGDWLVVCADQGRGPCRAVQIALEGDETRVGPARLAIHPEAAGGPALTLFMRGMPETGRDPVVFVIDGHVLPLRQGEWIAGEPGLPNVLETVTVADPAVTEELLRRMRAGLRLTVSYGGGGGPRGGDQKGFSLRGLTAALDAIEAREGKEAQ
jgi:hypothetical protein